MARARARARARAGARARARATSFVSTIVEFLFKGYSSNLPIIINFNGHSK